jgi:hypothetical protein
MSLLTLVIFCPFDTSHAGADLDGMVPGSVGTGLEQGWTWSLHLKGWAWSLGLPEQPGTGVPWSGAGAAVGGEAACSLHFSSMQQDFLSL